MARPVIVSTYPENESTGISTAARIIVCFNQDLDPATVTNLTVVLADIAAGYTAVSATVTYDATNYQAILTPNAYLTANTLYSLNVIGRDVNQYYGVAIANVAHEMMEETYSLSFTTGDGVDDTSGLIAPSGYVPRASSTVEDDFTPTFALDVVSIDPTDYESNVPIDLARIAITFNVATDMYDGEISSDIAGITNSADYQTRLTYFVEVTGRHILYSSPNASTTAPEWGAVETDRILYIYPSSQLAKNYEYTVHLRAGMPGVSSFALAEDKYYMFTTQMEPMYTTPDVIRLNPVGPLITDVPDDTINRVIFEHSITASSMYPGSIADTIPLCVHEYVTCATKLDMLEAALARMVAQGAGQEKRLGDMNIKYGIDMRPIQAMLDGLKKCKDRNKELVKLGCTRQVMQTVVKAQDDPRRPITPQSWIRLSADPKYPPFTGPRTTGRPSRASGLGF